MIVHFTQINCSPCTVHVLISSNGKELCKQVKIHLQIYSINQQSFLTPLYLEGKYDGSYTPPRVSLPGSCTEESSVFLSLFLRLESPGPKEASGGSRPTQRSRSECSCKEAAARVAG
jgi:hypothetical protein